MNKQTYELLEAKYLQYNQPDFIENDPISIPHQFKKKQDIEISGLFAAILAWGQRKTIINKCNELMDRMDRQPYDFIKNHTDSDLKKLLGFKHRTFNDTDLLYFVHFLQHIYQQNNSLEGAFIPINTEIQHAYATHIIHSPTDVKANICFSSATEFSTEQALIHFRHQFVSLPDFPLRSKKHISSPLQKSSCKRLNMFLRWMVRKDEMGVDFGIWSTLQTKALICPCDVHVDRVARKLNLIQRKKTDWLTALELTEQLRSFDANDPVKYDFALFGMGVEGFY